MMVSRAFVQAGNHFNSFFSAIMSRDHPSDDSAGTAIHDSSDPPPSLAHPSLKSQKNANLFMVAGHLHHDELTMESSNRGQQINPPLHTLVTIADDDEDDHHHPDRKPEAAASRDHNLEWLPSNPQHVSDQGATTATTSRISGNSAEASSSSSSAAAHPVRASVIPGLNRPQGVVRPAVVGDQQVPQGLVRKWPSALMMLMNDNEDDEWTPVINRIRSHPHEIVIQGVNGGMNALHAACLRYPPVHIIEALVQTAPEATMIANFNGETPLHLASYSASEEVQEVLIRAQPAAAALADIYGDCPMHFAARAGATYRLLELLLQAAPQCLSHANHRGVTPFWLLPRSYLEAESLQQILVDEAEDYGDDWNLLVLFLRYSYFGDGAAQAPRAATFVPNPNYDWLIFAAAAEPACPRATLLFLCRMFPAQALQYNQDGYTPLLLACQAPQEMKEPENWDENEDGFRSDIHPSQGELQNEDQAHVPQEHLVLSQGDADFVERVIRSDGYAYRDDDTSTSSHLSATSSSSEVKAPSDYESVVDILLEWSPQSVYYGDAQGRLPLAHALISKRSWKVIRRLVAACPRSLQCRDRPTGLYMFQLAAMHAPDLDSVFMAVRSLPDLVVSAARKDAAAATQNEFESMRGMDLRRMDAMFEGSDFTHDGKRAASEWLGDEPEAKRYCSLG